MLAAPHATPSPLPMIWVPVVLFAALALCSIVALSAGMTTLLQPPNLDVLAEPTDSAPTADPTPSPEPTATPTPAVYAPFGAQYGYGGADLIPKADSSSATSMKLRCGRFAS